MYRKLFCAVLLFVIAAGTALADKTPGDLYRVKVSSSLEAEKLSSAGVTPVYRLTDGYLVITDRETATRLQDVGLEVVFQASDVTVDLLAVDNRKDSLNAEKYPVVFEQNALRILKLNFAGQAQSAQGKDLIPIDNRYLKITWKQPVRIDLESFLSEIDLDTIINRVSQDSVTSYLNRLQAYHGRLTGTDSCYAAANWILGKFIDYGYTNIYFDYFTGYQLWDYYPVTSMNAVAVKEGSVYPNQQIVIGAHFDAVPESPGADDNGSGTVGVLEIARALKDIETERTIIFVAFDSEESGLLGSDNYAFQAAMNGDSIMLMLNMDMIAQITNSNQANLYYGSEVAYSKLWSSLASQYVGITGRLAGQSGSSDHASFIQNGYDAIFIQEYDFSTVYHTPHDSTTYCNFEYMTRMIKATLATAMVVDRALPPVTTTATYDGGDGMSVEVHWLPADPATVDRYWLFYDTEPSTHLDSIEVSKDSTRYLVSSLSYAQLYSFFVIAANDEGRSSIQYNKVQGTPYYYPALPKNQKALPVLGGIELYWNGNNTELDFDHYEIIRDGSRMPDIISDTSFLDDDPSLGTDVHDYIIVAVDTEDNISDTNGVAPVQMKAATLEPGRILAINRTSYLFAISEASLTGELLNEALGGYYYDYLSDSAYIKKADNISLIDLVDYGLLVIGAESGAGYDDIGQLPKAGGILDKLAYYLSLGGKVIIFGRWGNFSTTGNEVLTVNYEQGTHTGAYIDYFQVYSRILPLSYINMGNLTLSSDLVGAHSQMTGFPDLVWDSLATTIHSDPFTTPGGIPCQSLPVLGGGGIDVIYTYDSRTDSSLTEGQPVAWRHLGGLYEFYFFDIPLSFINRTEAVLALRQAISDLGVQAPEDDDLDGVPNPIDNCPTTYNPGQENNDLDEWGDVCDDDDDNDGYLDFEDNCPFVANGDQQDSDLDGVGDLCDICPGFDDNLDDDGDTHPNDCDNCPQTANADQADSDSDGVGNVCDNCPSQANADQLNSDGDSFGNVCDNCPTVTNQDQYDSDGDGHGNPCDNCPYVYNPGQEDVNGDDIGDACCCIGLTGNADCSESEEPDISDITTIIDYLYISHRPLCCPGEADADGSGGDPDISDITRIIDFLYHNPLVACE
jgi:hypothetical protein